MPLFLAMLFSGGLQSLHAQGLQGRALADSLISELPKTKSDTDQVKLIIKIARALESTDPPGAMHYTDSAIRNFPNGTNGQKVLG